VKRRKTPLELLHLREQETKTTNEEEKRKLERKMGKEKGKKVLAAQLEMEIQLGRKQ